MSIDEHVKLAMSHYMNMENYQSSQHDLDELERHLLAIQDRLEWIHAHDKLPESPETYQVKYFNGEKDYVYYTGLRWHAAKRSVLFWREIP